VVIGKITTDKTHRAVTRRWLNFVFRKSAPGRPGGVFIATEFYAYFKISPYIVAGFRLVQRLLPNQSPVSILFDTLTATCLKPFKTKKALTRGHADLFSDILL